MIAIACAILSLIAQFGKKKRQINILGKFPSDSNARNKTLYCEFSNALLRHADRMLPGINEKTQSHIFTSGLVSLRAQRPLQINMEIDLLFSYYHERPSE